MRLIDYPDSDPENEDYKHLEQTKDALVFPESDLTRDELSSRGPLSKKRKAEQTDGPGIGRSKLPRLPTAFHSMYATNVRTSISDDPLLHGGRTRQVPHTEGNWPSHVYLEWIPEKHDMEILDDLIHQSRGQLPQDQQLNSFLRSPLEVQLPLHISLSAPLVLTTPMKEDFRTHLKNALQHTRIQSFEVIPSGLDWVPNFDGSRHFLILRLASAATGELNQLLRICNVSCGKFNLPTLYQQGDMVGVTPGTPLPARSTRKDHRFQGDVSTAFHISIAWALQDPSDEARKAVRQLCLGPLNQKRIKFMQIQIKIGNVVESVSLYEQ